MMQGERGQVFILVLILLALGSMLIAPSLSLGTTALQSGQIHTELLEEQYAAEGALQAVMWQLLYDSSFLEQVTGDGGGTLSTVTLNGVDVTATIGVKTPPRLSGIGLAKNYQVKPTKTVCPDGVDDGPDDPCPQPVDPGIPTTFTYTITMERLEPDDTVFEGVEEIEDGLPLGLTYVPNSSALDGVPFNDDDLTILEEPVEFGTVAGGYQHIKWEFQPNLDFEYGEKRTLSFQAYTTGLADGRYCNGAMVEPDDARTSPTGMTAEIVVGNPPTLHCPGGGIRVGKSVDPVYAVRGQETTFTYVISITNNDVGAFSRLDRIEDYLPPGFTYVPGSASAAWPNLNSTDNPYYPYNICDFEPKEKLEPDNRWKLDWHEKDSVNGGGTELCHDQPLPEGVTYTQVFQAAATLEESRLYNNEVFVRLKDWDTYGGKRGLSGFDWALTWPTAPAYVPGFDVQVEAGGTTISANTLFDLTGININSLEIE